MALNRDRTNPPIDQDSNIVKLPVVSNVEQAWCEYAALVESMDEAGADDPDFVASVNRAYADFERLYKRWAA